MLVSGIISFSKIQKNSDSLPVLKFEKAVEEIFSNLSSKTILLAQGLLVPHSHSKIPVLKNISLTTYVVQV